MHQIQGMFEEALKSVPRLVLEKHLSKKIKAAGGKTSKKVISKIATALLEGKENDVNISGLTSDLEFTDNDLIQVEAGIERFYNEGMSAMIKSSSDRIARTLYDALHAKLTREVKAQKRDHNGFKKRLHLRFGVGLDKMRMMLTVAREWAGELHNRKTALQNGSISTLDDVLFRNHVRACQVVTEIIDLLENGLADGAMARWRTLHEIATVATFVRKYGEGCAIRYKDYQVVESKRAADLYKKNHVTFGFKPMSAKSDARLKVAFERVVKKHGPLFAEEYGWAGSYFKGGRANFGKIEEHVGIPEMRSVYKLASYNVHATPKGAYYRIGAIEGAGALIGGYSNAGLTEPAQNTAVSFVNLCTIIVGDEAKFFVDDIVVLKILDRLRAEIPRDIWNAEKKLKRDDRRFRGAGKGRSTDT